MTGCGWQTPERSAVRAPHLPHLCVACARGTADFPSRHPPIVMLLLRLACPDDFRALRRQTQAFAFDTIRI